MRVECFYAENKTKQDARIFQQMYLGTVAALALADRKDTSVYTDRQTERQTASTSSSVHNYLGSQ